MFVGTTYEFKLMKTLRSLGWHENEIDKYIKYVQKKDFAVQWGRKSLTDSEKSKVYESEFKFESQVEIKKFKTLEDANKRLKQITSSKLWSDLEGKSVYLTSNARLGRRTAGRASSNGNIELAFNALNEYVLIHELAHQTPRSMHHGVQFRINLLKLVSRFMGTESAKILKKEFRARKLRVSHSKPQKPETWIKSYRRMEKMRARI